MKLTQNIKKKRKEKWVSQLKQINCKHWLNNENDCSVWKRQLMTAKDKRKAVN